MILEKDIGAGALAGSLQTVGKLDVSYHRGRLINVLVVDSSVNRSTLVTGELKKWTLNRTVSNQLKTQNKNILEISAQKLINRKIFRLQINKLLYESDWSKNVRALEF